MMRWAWAKTLAAGLACAGLTAGQAPPSSVSARPPAPSSPPGATDGPREGDVIALRTAGQPERKVKVLRVTRPDGGEALADLQDTATGARYTVPARMLTAKPRPVSPPAGRSALAHNPTRWNGSARTAVRPPATTPVAATPKLVAYRPPAPSRAIPKEERPAPPPPVAVQPKPTPAPIVEPAKTPSAVAAPPVTPLARERPLPPPVAPPLTALRPATELVPALIASGVPPTPVGESRPVTRRLASAARSTESNPGLAPKSEPEVRPAGVFDPLPMNLAPPVPTPAADPMADETGPYLRDLFGAVRPSVRERAATALAECRYGSRPEVKAQLAKAAAADPSPDVRAHCVRLLSKLGYHESRYLDDLAGWAESGAPPLRQAAREALARIAVKQ